MRDAHDRRHSHHPNPYPMADNGLDALLAERRKTADRRMENLTLEERQCLFSEMPSPPLKSR